MSTLIDDDEVGEEAPGRPRRRALTRGVVGAPVVGLGVWSFVLRPQERPSLDAEVLDDAPREVALDPCSLISAEEAASVLDLAGEPSEQAGMGVLEDQRVCMYPTSGGATAVLLGVLDGAGGRTLGGSEAAGEVGFEGLEGVGDAARWLAQFRLLAVTSGDWLVTVQTLAPGEDPAVTLERATSVAELAVERLP